MADSNYVNWYTAQNYDRVQLILPKGSKERIKEEAKKSNQTVCEYIRSFLPDWLICERKYIRKKEGLNDERLYSGIGNNADTEQG